MCFFLLLKQVILLGHSDSYMRDKAMQVTIAYNHFGVGLIQRMPRYIYKKDTECTLFLEECKNEYALLLRSVLLKLSVSLFCFLNNAIKISCRCRHGYFHVVNNDYTHWEMYAIGGSAGPTINSQGNRYAAPKNPFAKEVIAQSKTVEPKPDFANIE